MSFRGAPRGRGTGANFGGGRGGGGGFSRGGCRGGFGGRSDFGPPDHVFELGALLRPCEGEMVCESTNSKIPYFNAPVYLENKTAIGKVDEIFGPINQVYFTIKPSEGIQATSFKAGDKFYIGGDKLLPLEKFLPKPKVVGAAPKRKIAGGRGGAIRGGGRGGRGGFTPRGGARGGFASRGGPRSGSRGGFTPRGRGAPRGGARGGRGGY